MGEAGHDSDEALVRRIQRGDHRAFATLVRRHTNMFFAAAYRMCGNRSNAEEIVQEAFLKLWQKPAAWDPAKGTKFTTWFYRVIMNISIDRHRREKKYTGSAALDFIPDSAPRADEEIQKNEKEIIVEKAIAALPDRQKAALNLCYYEGLSNKEAADTLGIGIKALESLLMRAKATLRGDMEQSGLIMKPVYRERSGSHAG